VRQTRLNRVAFHLGQVLWFASIPATLLAVGYSAYVAAQLWGGR